MAELDVESALPELAALRGTDLGASDWKRMDQADIDAFSALTGDAGPIHNNPAEATRIGPFGGTIVQGSYLLACLTGFAKGLRLPDDGARFRMNYGFDRVRLIAPVATGRRVRGRFVLADLVGRGSQAALITLEATVEIEGGDTPALVADWLIYLQLNPEETP